MKPMHYLLSLFLLASLALQAQPEPILAKEEWAELVNKPFLLDFFDGFFVDLGIEVMETGEKLTVTRAGDHFEIRDGFDPGQVDLSLQIGTENIKNLVSHAKDGKLDDLEKYATLAVLFTPITAKTLKDPLIYQNVPGFVKKKDNNLHVTLYSPDKQRSVSHTILYLNKEWIVVPGLHGTAKRTYSLDVEQALLYQRKVFEALRANTRKDWKAFRRW
ncbi:MAG: hypothetical protein KDC44_09095 [Phaeodactylibacter sp.]|nr:hypothetical protein [Phaeodactylibacter sp.]